MPSNGLASGWSFQEGQEIKKGKYVYYHCTGNAGPCGKPIIREEKLEELLGETVRAISIGVETVEWIKLALRESHKDEKEYHDAQVANLQAQYNGLQDKMDRAYDDKLEGRITETFWQRKSAEWREAQFATLAAIETHQRANTLYFDEGFRILELAGKAHDLWLTQTQDEKRKLLNLLQSNCTFDGVSLTATYRKPFCWLAEGSLNDDWLPDREAIPMVNN